jgi:hypothetical protein
MAADEGTPGEEPDLDALLRELGGDSAPAETPAPEAKTDEVDLDALLAELGEGSPAAAEPAPDAREPAPAESAEVDLDALLAELEGTPETPSARDETQSAQPGTPPATPPEAHPETALAKPRPEPSPSTSSSLPPSSTLGVPKRPAPPPPKSVPPPSGAFDSEPEEESKPAGPGWSRFSKSGYAGGKASERPSQPKPWKRTAAPGDAPADKDAGQDGKKAGWSKLKPDASRGDDEPSGPSAGWDKLRK